MQQSRKFSWSFPLTTPGSKWMPKERRHAMVFPYLHFLRISSLSSLCENFHHHQTPIWIKLHTKQGWGQRKGKKNEWRIRYGRENRWERKNNVLKKQNIDPNENHSLVTKRLATAASIQCHAYNYVCTVWGSLGDGEKHLLLSPQNFTWNKNKN